MNLEPQMDVRKADERAIAFVQNAVDDLPDDRQHNAQLAMVHIVHRLRGVSDGATCIQSDAERLPRHVADVREARLREIAVGNALDWLRSALDCKQFAWDSDQRQDAEAALSEARRYGTEGNAG